MDTFHSVIIYSHQAAILLGRSEKYAREKLRQIRRYYKKKAYDLVTVPEFCQQMNLDIHFVMASLKVADAKYREDLRKKREAKRAVRKPK